MANMKMKSSDTAATGTVSATKALVRSVTLTPAAAVATLVLRDGGAGGTVLLRLQAAANGNSQTWGDGESVLVCATDIHVTIGGAGANVNVGYQPE